MSVSKRVLTQLIGGGLLAAALLYAPAAQAKEKVHALYIPLADHYAAILAYDRYRSEMKEADFSIEQMKSWPSLRGKFMAKAADMAFIISPMAMNMFQEDNTIRWIGLAHRDGNALAINQELEKYLKLAADRQDRKPSADIARAFAEARKKTGKPTTVAVPSLESTHTLIMYKFLKDNGLSLAIGKGDGDVIARAVAPPKSPEFLVKKNRDGEPASFEQSLPWADVVETGGFGRVAWYSKDVLPTDQGHVECIVIAQGSAVSGKAAAIREAMYYVHKAGQDIEAARLSGGDELRGIATTINRYIPGHTVKAIMASLNAELEVINYRNLNVDEAGLKTIMNLAIDAGVMKGPIDIQTFSDDRFGTDITAN